MAQLNQLEQDEKYLEGLRKRDNQVLEEIYQRYYPSLAQLVSQRGGNEDDAKDVFQETLIVVFRKVKQVDFALTSQFHTFLIAVGKRIWLHKASRKSQRPHIPLTEVESEVVENIEEEIQKTEKYRLYREKIALLGKDCQRVLRLFLGRTSMQQIAQQMGYASEAYAKKRKFQCKQQLTKLIKSDRRFQEMKE
ncbi:MAG: sigma-70 family RNA polymerase sigma factor [Bacteroidota bacterium]